jgi:pyruvate,water dikinase
VLQARPITTLAAAEGRGDGFDTDSVRGERYVAAGVTEMLPGVIPPLLWTMNGPMVEEAFRTLFARLHVLPDGIDGPFGFVARRRGRARLNITAMQRTTEGLAGWSPAEVERLYLGNEVEDETPNRGSRLRAMAVSARAFRLRGQAPREAEAFVAAVPAAMSGASSPSMLLDSELIAYRWRVRDLAASGMRAEVTVAAVAVSAYRALETLLENWVGEEGPIWAQRLTRHAGRNDDTPVGRACARLAAMEPADRDRILGVLGSSQGDPREAVRALGAAGSAFVDGVTEDLHLVGSAAIYGGPTWEEQSAYLWSTFGGALSGTVVDDSTAHASADLATLEREVASTAKWRFVRIITGQIVDMRIRFLRRLVHDTVAALSYREQAKQALLVLGGEERRVIGEMADRLVRRGVLDTPESIELLADWELDSLMSGGLGPPSMELRRRHQVLSRWRSEPAAPVAAAVARTGDTTLRGWGASPGVYRGKVRVVLDPVTAGDVDDGVVLVAPATDPSWVPLLLKAGALVVERGGPLSHAAIVAREFGLPAVLNIPDATTLLHGIEEAQVDGTAGEVLVLASAGSGQPEEVR